MTEDDLSKSHEPGNDTAASVGDDRRETASETPPSEQSGPETLDALRQDRDQLKDRLLRVAADYENFRKRTRRELEDALHRAKEDTLRELLPIIDNLERAAHAARSADDVAAVADGVKMVLRGFEDVANRLGLTRIKSVGEPFDPTIHDAMQQMETDEHPPGTIISEAVPGYMLGDRLLRPAMVLVARPPTGKQTTEEDPSDEGVLFFDEDGNEESGVG